MTVIRSLGQSVLATARCRLCLLGLVGFAIATVAIVYGLTNDDTVTALGALLFVPSAALLFGIGRRRSEELFGTGERQTS